MVANKTHYLSAIKLGPALGDWTKIQRSEETQVSEVAPIQQFNFDSLPEDILQKALFQHYRLAEKITQKLSEDMTIKVELHSIVAEQLLYKKFTETQSDRYVQADFSVKDMGRTTLMMDWHLVETVINRLTGGKGELTKQDTFSDLEMDILDTQIQELLPIYSDIWKSIFKAEDVETDIYFGDYVYDKRFSENETYIVFRFYFNFGDNHFYKMSWAYSNHVLRKMLSSKSNVPDPLKKRIKLHKETLTAVKIACKAIVGESTVSLEELKNIQKGDVIELNTTLQDPFVLQLNKEISIPVQPGVLDHQLAAQILGGPTLIAKVGQRTQTQLPFKEEKSEENTVYSQETTNDIPDIDEGDAQEVPDVEVPTVESDIDSSVDFEPEAPLESLSSQAPEESSAEDIREEEMGEELPEEELREEDVSDEEVSDVEDITETVNEPDAFVEQEGASESEAEKDDEETAVEDDRDVIEEQRQDTEDETIPEGDSQMSESSEENDTDLDTNIEETEEDVIRDDIEEDFSWDDED